MIGKEQRADSMTIDDYISNQRELIQLDHQYFKKIYKKWNSKKKKFTFYLNENGNLETNINVPYQLTPPPKVNNPSKIYISDKVKILFTNNEIEPLEGKVSQIKNSQITAIFDSFLTEENLKKTHKCTVEIYRNDDAFPRQLEALDKLKFLNEDLQKVLCRIYPTKQMTPDIELFLTKGYEFNESQIKAIRMAVSNPFSLIHGPPGTGKTHTIGAIAIQALHQYPNKKVLICGPTKVSINRLLEVVGDMIQVAGFKACCPGRSINDYILEEDITKEQKFTTFYLSRHMNSIQSQRFNQLCLTKSRTHEENDEFRTLRTQLENIIIQESDILFTTLESSSKYLINNISTLIVDEATLSVESSMIFPLSLLPDRLILVGNQKQHFQYQQSSKLNKKNYYQSLFERIINEKNCLNNIVMLNTQYRMHPDISRLPNHLFYNDELIDSVNNEDRQIEQNFVNTYKIHSHFNFVNYDKSEEEINLIFKFVNALIKSGINQSQIGVISAYNKQAELISREFVKSFINVKVSTIYSFQSSQKDYIIFSTTETGNKPKFVKDEERINVAITRAKCMVAIFGNAEVLMESKCWESVIEYAKNNNSFFEKLPVVFDQNDARQIDSEFKEEEINAGYKLREIKSEISDSIVRILWPDEKEDILYLKEWVQKRVDILNDKKYVTLAYDAEGICMQFGDIFENDIDYYNWKSSNKEIPKIKTSESIIISFYKHSDDFALDKSLVDIMKPLLEHPRITLITFDFTFDFDKFYNFGINIKTNQIIDAQLMNLPKNINKNGNEDLICSTGWKSIAKNILQSNGNNINRNMISRAKKSIKNNKKKFPHEENIFLINHLKYPPICQFTNIFLEYSAGDIFYTAITGIDVLSKDKLDEVKERSIEKFKKYTEYRMKYGCVCEIRCAYYASESFSLTTQEHFSQMETYSILSYYKKLNSFVSVLDKCPTIIKVLIPSFAEVDIRQNYDEIVEILIKDEHLKNIKKNAILTHIPTLKKNPENIKLQKSEINDQQKANNYISTNNEKTQVQSLINIHKKQHIQNTIVIPKPYHSSNKNQFKQQLVYNINAQIEPEQQNENEQDIIIANPRRSINQNKIIQTYQLVYNINAQIEPEQQNENEQDKIITNPRRSINQNKINQQLQMHENKQDKTILIANPKLPRNSKSSKSPRARQAINKNDSKENS